MASGTKSLALGPNSSLTSMVKAIGRLIVTYAAFSKLSSRFWHLNDYLLYNVTNVNYSISKIKHMGLSLNPRHTVYLKKNLFLSFCSPACLILFLSISCIIHYSVLCVWLGGRVVRTLDLRSIASQVRIPASPLSSATLGKLLTHMCL